MTSERSVGGKKKFPVLFGLALAAGMTTATSAWAAPINVTSQRSVVVGDLEHGSTYGDFSPWGSNGGFDDEAGMYVGGTHHYPGYPDFTTREWASATQRSVVDADSWLVGATGNVGIGFSVVDADLAFAKSTVDVWFDLASAHTFKLTGTLGSYMDGGLGLASVTLDGPTSFAFEQQGWGKQTLAHDGTLAAGSYHLNVSTLIRPECEPADCTAFSWMGGGSSFDVGMQVAAVPEPATVAMLLAGLGVLGFVAKRKALPAS